ncbi:TPA: tyrosine-type recombinase/integrase [Legionella bozemanae]
MFNSTDDIDYQSPIALLIKQFIQEKRACGRQYKEAPKILKQFDHFLCQKTLKEIALPESLVLCWLEKFPKEQASTHQRRIGLVRQLGKMMIRLGYPAYIVPAPFGSPRNHTFLPYIFTREEISKLIHAADQIKPSAKTPWRHLVMPEIFRLLYSCGFRVSEVLNLRLGDVDLSQGVITVRKAKHDKDRLVPPALNMVERLRIYSEQIASILLEKQTDESFFFPSSEQTAWSISVIYFQFRMLLYQCGIPHAGRGKGPRVHDLRHTFAVHRLIQWYEEGADLNAKLPLLVAYLGHQDFTGTQKYLHLTAELFPNLTERMNKQFGGVIPHWR